MLLPSEKDIIHLGLDYLLDVISKGILRFFRSNRHKWLFSVRSNYFELRKKVRLSKWIGRRTTDHSPPWTVDRGRWTDSSLPVHLIPKHIFPLIMARHIQGHALTY